MKTPMTTRQDAPNTAKVVDAPKALIKNPPMSSPDPCPSPQWTPCKIPKVNKKKEINNFLDVSADIQHKNMFGE